MESRSWRDRNLKFGPNCDLKVDNLENNKKIGEANLLSTKIVQKIPKISLGIILGAALSNINKFRMPHSWMEDSPPKPHFLLCEGRPAVDQGIEKGVGGSAWSSMRSLRWPGLLTCSWDTSGRQRMRSPKDC